MHIKIGNVQASKNDGRIGRSPARKRAASFLKVLKDVQSETGVSFSKHAEQRLQSWGRELKPEQITRLENAVDLARSKGARTTLVLMKDVAFVVAPQSRKVVTVVPEERMKENVFTSIDSAVLVDQ